MTSIALTIAGSDSGGGAGIQADLKAFSALGTYGASVITAVTAQNTCAVTAVHEIPSDVVAAQIKAVLDDLEVNAIKVGMLFSPAIIHETAKALSGKDIPIVLDPVMIAKSGDSLLQEVAVSSMINEIFPLADLLTPNLPEAAVLLGRKQATTEQEMESQGQALMQLGPKAVLVKGGHATGGECIDILVQANQPSIKLKSKRLDTQNTHGTGCTLSASIAAGLAKGMPLTDAVVAAHEYLRLAIIAADDLTIGSGHGPVHHFHQVWA